MKKEEAKRVKKLIDSWVKKHWLWKKFPEDRMIHTQIEESDVSKGWWGVKIYTDGLWYDYLYTNEGYYVDEVEAKEFGIKKGATGGVQDELQVFLNKKMKWGKEEHYFEPYGQGILDLY